MLIRKLFRFENAHIVRGCSTRRYAHSIHGHSYKVELLLEAHALDHGQMVYDFGLLMGCLAVAVAYIVLGLIGTGISLLFANTLLNALAPMFTQGLPSP